MTAGSDDRLAHHLGVVGVGERPGAVGQRHPPHLVHLVVRGEPLVAQGPHRPVVDELRRRRWPPGSRCVGSRACGTAATPVSSSTSRTAPAAGARRRAACPWAATSRRSVAGAPGRPRRRRRPAARPRRRPPARSACRRRRPARRPSRQPRRPGAGRRPSARRPGTWRARAGPRPARARRAGRRSPRACDRPGRPRAMDSHVSAAIAASWCSPSRSCTAGQRLGQLGRLPPTALATASTAYRARLPRIRTACQRRPARVRSRSAAPPTPSRAVRELPPRPRHQPGQHAVGPALRGRCQPRLPGGGDQRLEQRERSARWPAPRPARAAPPRAGRPGRRRCGRPRPRRAARAGRRPAVRRSRSRSTSASRAAPSTSASQPSSSRRPRAHSRVHQRPERPQVAAQPPAADPHLVHGRVVLADAGAAAGPADRARRSARCACADRGDHHVAGRAASAGQRRRRHQVGRRRVAGSPSARTCLGGKSPARGAGLAAARPRPCRAACRQPCLALDLDLAEPAGDLPAVEHRDRVVGDLGEHAVVGVAQLVRPAHACAARRPGPAARPGCTAVTSATSSAGGVPGGPAREISWRTPGAPVGSLTVHGSRVAAAVAQRGAGAGQPQVGGVVVGGA